VPSRLQVISALVATDLRVLSRARWIVVAALLGVLACSGLFWLLPADDQGPVGLGVHLPGGEALLEQRDGDQGTGFVLVPFDSPEALEAAVATGEEVVAGMDFPQPFLELASRGEHTTVRVLVGSDTPAALRPLLISGVQEIVATLGQLEPAVTLPVMQDVLVGPERGGQRLSWRERVRPLVLFTGLVIAMLVLASLVAAEIAQRSQAAVLLSPATGADVATSKVLVGTAFASVVVLLIAASTQSLTGAVPVLLLALLLGAALLTGFGLLVGATSGGLRGVVGWSMFFVVPLSVPAIAALSGAGAPSWVRGLPTYGLVQTIIGATAYGEGFAQLWPHLAWLAGWCALSFLLASWVLARSAARA
jgi:ABC-2 type transport system permease protein